MGAVREEEASTPEDSVLAAEPEAMVQAVRSVQARAQVACPAPAPPGIDVKLGPRLGCEAAADVRQRVHPLEDTQQLNKTVALAFAATAATQTGRSSVELFIQIATALQGLNHGVAWFPAPRWHLAQ